LEHIKDIYKINFKLCDELIDLYDKSSRQLFKLAEAWDKFKNRRRITTSFNNTSSDDEKRRG